MSITIQQTDDTLFSHHKFKVSNKSLRFIRYENEQEQSDEQLPLKE